MSDPLATRLSLRLGARCRRGSSPSCSCPGHALGGGTDGRASRVVDHVLSMDDSDVATVLETIIGRFAARHRDLDAMFRHHAERLANRLAAGFELSAQRKLLLGATFTHEYSVEAAAAVQPECSRSARPVRPPTGNGALRAQRPTDRRRTSLVDRLPLRHPRRRRCGLDRRPGPVHDRRHDRGVDPRRHDVPGRHRRTATPRSGCSHAWGHGSRTASSPPACTSSRPRATPAATFLPPCAAYVSSPTGTTAYRSRPSSRLDERVLSPAYRGRVERSRGRPVRALRRRSTAPSPTTPRTPRTTGRPSPSSCSPPPTSTPSRRSHCSDQPQRTRAWRCSRDGSVDASTRLSRFDGATNAVAMFERSRRLADAAPLDVDAPDGSLSRSETADHRSSSTRAGSCSPTASARCAPTRSARSSSTSTTRSSSSARAGSRCSHRSRDEQDGYVPNVVYSCGSLRHGDVLLVPFGIADANVGFATFSIDDIVAAMDAPAPRPPRHNTERRTDA